MEDGGASLFGGETFIPNGLRLVLNGEEEEDMPSMMVDVEGRVMVDLQPGTVTRLRLEETLGQCEDLYVEQENTR